MVDYIIDYHENIKDRPVLPTIKPGYLRPLIPEEAPEVHIYISVIDRRVNRKITDGYANT